MKSGAGFSLIELLVVLTLLVVLATLLPQGLQRLYANSSADEAAYAIAAQLEDCALRALQDQRTRVAGVGRNANCRIDVAANVQLLLKDGIEPVFYADGTSNGSHMVVAHEQRKLFIVINPINARISVQANDGH